MENKIINRLPFHLKQYIVEQDYSAYSAIDQAVWRYVMTKNVSKLPKIAHESYLEGLKKTGISAERIPTIDGMNAILQKIGWAAVAVDGFIPPSAFMEFQAYKILVIATDIRQINHLEYTPAPDILHEAAGHAPIITNPEYAEYLRRLGEIGCKAISSSKDFELYEAIRHLSIVKEAPDASSVEVYNSQKMVEKLQADLGEPSEMAQIRNIQWWTVEYGLIGDIKNPKIYGAGLLSSIAESESCLKTNIIKHHYDLSAAKVNFDITKPQPHLFVTPNFAHLSFVLEQFANSLSLRRGGSKGIVKLIESKQLGTVTYNTGIQVSGVFSEIITNEENEPIYFKTIGKTALSYHENELIGHSTDYHHDGFGSPIGKLINSNLPIEKMSPHDLELYKIVEGYHTVLEFDGGISVEGDVITGVRTIMGDVILISFRNCTVKYFDSLLFHPDWGQYDMAVGSSIVSAFSGSADNSSFEITGKVAKEKTIKVAKSPELVVLEKLYEEVQNMDETETKRAIEIIQDLTKNHHEDWLLKSIINEKFEKLI